MLAAIHLAPEMDLADVEPVLEQMGERSHAKSDPAPLLALPAPIAFGPDAPPVEFREQRAHGAEFQIKGENGADRLGLLGHVFEFFVDAAIAEGNRSADPEAFALGGHNLVAHPLADD